MASEFEDYIAGRNAVNEALRSGRAIDKILIAKGERSGSINVIIAQCRERGIPVKRLTSESWKALPDLIIRELPPLPHVRNMQPLTTFCGSRGKK